MCEVGKCKRPPALGYYNYEVCQFHWDKHCDEDDKFDLKKALEIEEEDS